MAQSDLVIRGRQVVAESTVGPASVHIRGGRIAAIAAFEEVSSNCKLIEAKESSVVMAGLVDTHVHVNEPGRTEWEGFESATRAAAAGGVTTIVDMPLNCIPATTTFDNFQSKLAATGGKLHVDTAFWGGVVPGNTGELSGLWGTGVVGFKCFLIHSGVDEFPNVSEMDLREAMPELARLGATLIVHAELPGPIELACCQSSASMGPDNARSYVSFPHYLHFTAEEVPDGATEFKCCPPIRERANREELWQALSNGTLDMVVSDHSPCPPEMKLREQGDFLKAWGGISSLQFRLPIMWTEASKRGFTINRLAEWCCRAPAKLVGMERRKGSLAVGCDADIVIWNPEAEFRLEPRMIHHRHKLTPYAGEVLRGKVEKTFLRGEMVYDDGEFDSNSRGQLILRGKN